MGDFDADVERRKSRLFEAQRKVAMLEIVKTNRANLERLRHEQAEALEAARAARRNLIEHRQAEKKKMLDAVRMSLAPFSRKRTRECGETSGAPADSSSAEKRAHC